jgi:hypothetical protein
MLTLEYKVMAFAAPAGGILCMELLKPAQQTSARGISRSSIIQQLSLLVGFLGWVKPCAPNSDICNSCKTVIQHVLDQTLNGLPASIEPTLDTLDFDLSSSNLNDYFNFGLLDTFDWLRSDIPPGH